MKLGPDTTSIPSISKKNRVAMNGRAGGASKEQPKYAMKSTKSRIT